MDPLRSRAITDPRELESLDRPRPAPMALEALFHTRIIGAAGWSPDGRQVVFAANLSGRQNLWLAPAPDPLPMPVPAPGPGWPVQLTISEQRQASPAWSPDGSWIAFISDRDGDEQWDLFLVSPRTGEVVNLTNTPDIAEQNPVWSPDGRWLAYIAKPRQGSSFEVRLLAMATRESQALTRNSPREYGCYGPVWSPAGDAVAYTREHASGRDSDVFMVSAAGGEARQLTAHGGERRSSAAAWAPQGNRLLLTSNVGNGYDNVALLDIGGDMTWLTQEEWDSEAGGFSPDGGRIVYTANVDGETAIFLFDPETGRARELALPRGVNAPEGEAGGLDRAGSRLLLSHGGAESPGDLWAYSLASDTSFPLTRSLVGGLRGEDMVAPVLAHLPSSDGQLQISAWVYVPHGIARNGRHPGVVYIHGGPAAQAMNSFNRAVQLLANRGYVVIAPNYRGSTGYGQAFQEANRRDLGGGDLADVMAAADWLLRSGFVDPAKLAAMGGSYGGYLTAMALTRHPRRWAAGVAIVPFVNWFTEIANEDPLLREYDLATMGDPEQNRALFEDRSPLYHVDKICAPILLLAGAQDPRCPKSEAEQVAAAIQARGGVAELKIYADEGHGFARVENQVDAYRRVEAFLLRHVPPPTAGEPPDQRPGGETACP